MQTMALPGIPLPKKLTSFAGSLIDFLYGDEHRTERTLGLSCLALALSALLSSMQLGACGL